MASALQSMAGEVSALITRVTTVTELDSPLENV